MSVEKFDLSDDELAAAAKKAAKSVEHLVGMWQARNITQADQLHTLRRLARRHRVEAPAKQGLHATINRMCEPAWWRRALRRRFRLVEHAAIIAGRVHNRASPYVSDSAARRFERNRKRVAELLAALEAVNQTTGEVIQIAEVVEKSLANPAMRRKALAARIKGTEQYFDDKGLEKWLVTITCPSRFHARHKASGRANNRYVGSSPRQAQAYLTRLWGNATRSLAHQGIEPYGLRVTEPNHDGTPHWHVLMFVDPARAADMLATLRRYAMRDSPNEPGADAHRFDAKLISADKGSALGYVLKYISKSIDGEGVTTDHASGLDGKTASGRIVAWSREWGIRQFQFFGVPPITPTREVYRVMRDSLPSQALRAAHDAAKANDYAEWLRNADAFSLSFKVDRVEQPSQRYVGELASRIVGLTATACDLPSAASFITRTDDWRIQFRREEAENGAAASPWTRFNKSASPVESTTCDRRAHGSNDRRPQHNAPGATAQKLLGPPPPRQRWPKRATARKPTFPTPC
jgi:hypothetical protein